MKEKQINYCPYEIVGCTGHKCSKDSLTPPAEEKGVTGEKWTEVDMSFKEYMSQGYAGGLEGLRCSLCDHKYSGDTTNYPQLCPVCRAHKAITQAKEEERKRLAEKIEKMYPRINFKLSDTLDKDWTKKDVVKVEDVLSLINDNKI